MALVEIKENKLNLLDKEDELLTQTETLVGYIISDLEDLYELFNNSVESESKQIINKHLITLTMVLEKIDNIKIVSHKQYHLNN